MLSRSEYLPLIWLVGISIFLTKFQIDGKFEYTNIVCTPLDKTFAEFDSCHIKAVNRTYKYISLKVKVYKKPVTDITMGIAIMKRYNGYKPFLYNFTIDFCRFLAKPNSQLVSFMHGLFKTPSNINHSCPYNDDIILDKLPAHYLDTILTNKLPLPEGDYCFVSNWMAYGISRVNVKVYFTLTH